jgi:ankyrin repeat protein
MNELQLFFDAIKKGSAEAVRESLDQNPSLAGMSDPDGGLSGLMTALYYGHPEIAKLFIERGVSLNQFEAAASGEIGLLQELLEAQPARINDYSPDGFQALGLAAFFGQVEAAGWLLDQGAEVNTPSRNRMRVCPLHSAVAAQSLDIARNLIEHGADVNAVQSDDFTPLMGAAQNGQLDMIKLLLAHGAQPDAKRANGQTALDLAREGGHAAAAELLKPHAGGEA